MLVSSASDGTSFVILYASFAWPTSPNVSPSSAHRSRRVYTPFFSAHPDSHNHFNHYTPVLLLWEKEV